MNQQTLIDTKILIIELEKEYQKLLNSNATEEQKEAQLNKLNEAKNTQAKEYIKSLDLTGQRIVALRDLEVARIKNSEDFAAGWRLASDEYISKQKTIAEQAMEIHASMASSMTSGFENFFDRTSDGYMKLGTLATSVLNDILKATLRASVINPLVGSIMGGLGSLFGGTTISPASEAAASSVASGGSLTDAYFGYAKGGAFASSSLSAYSSSIVDKPTPFMFAKGGALGIMGEAGAEAIMPLARNSSGELGVKVANQGTQNIKVEIKNESSQQMEVTSVQQSMDTEGIVLSIVVNGIQKNKMGLRDMLGR